MTIKDEPFREALAKNADSVTYRPRNVPEYWMNLERENKELRAENERLRAELARWKPSECGRIYPVPVPGEVVKHCTREVDHDGPHQTGDTVWGWLGNDKRWISRPRTIRH